MLRRAWQSGMIALARSRRVKQFMQQRASASRLAMRYIAGTSPAAEIKVCEQLAAGGIRASAFFLGEYVTSPDLVEVNVVQKLAIVRLLASAGLDVHVSVDPTQLGQLFDPPAARANILRLGEAVRDAAGNRPGVHCVMLDIEDSSVTDATLAHHEALLAERLPAAQTLQAYLKRTENDLVRLISAGAKVRLVKGAFAESPDRAFVGRREIKRSYRRLMALMLAPEARASGFYPIFATHDDRLQEEAIELARVNNWQPGSYEFEMLYGARPDVAQALAARGERVRLYVPFGQDWFPYAIRRIGENPRNALLLGRALMRSGGR